MLSVQLLLCVRKDKEEIWEIIEDIFKAACMVLKVQLVGLCEIATLHV